MKPDSQFSFSDGWFRGFKERFHLSFRRATNTCQKEPNGKLSVIQKFHIDIRRMAKEGCQVSLLGQWTARSIGNPSLSVMVKCMLTWVSALCGYEEGRLVWGRGSVQHS